MREEVWQSFKAFVAANPDVMDALDFDFDTSVRGIVRPNPMVANWSPKMAVAMDPTILDRVDIVSQGA
eukprot:690489-Hanusia_phi.AAC.1